MSKSSEIISWPIELCISKFSSWNSFKSNKISKFPLLGLGITEIEFSKLTSSILTAPTLIVSWLVLEHPFNVPVSVTVKIPELE